MSAIVLIVSREREGLVLLADIQGFILERDNGMISFGDRRKGFG